MLKSFQKKRTRCTQADARFLHLLFLGREPVFPAEIDLYTELTFFGAMKRALDSPPFSRTVLAPFRLGKRPMQFDLSEGQSELIFAGMQKHFGVQPAGELQKRWPQCLSGALGSDRLQKAFLKIHSADHLQYLSEQLARLDSEAPSFIGSVQQTHGTTVHGFASCPGSDKPLSLDLYLDGTFVASTTADEIHRKITDDKETSQKVGFTFDLDKELDSDNHDALLMVFESSTGTLVCPPKEIVTSPLKSLQTLTRLVHELVETRESLQKTGDHTPLEASLRRLEHRLPAYERFSELPIEDYTDYRKLFGPALPPGLKAKCRIAVLLAGGPADLLRRTHQSMDELTYDNFDVFGAGEHAEADGFDFILPLDAGDTLDPLALAWIAATAEQYPEARVIRFGYDHLGDDETVHNPVFVAEFDPLILAQQPAYATAFAVRASGIGDLSDLGAPERLLQSQWDRFGTEGFVVIEEVLETKPAPKTNIQLLPLTLPAPQPEKKLCIVIPTRDRLDLVQPCVESLLQTIEMQDRTEILIVDNNSSDRSTLEWFDKIASGNAPKTAPVRIVRDQRPFNWAALNNQAVQKTDADLLLFLNNDTLATEKGWDLTLRSLLQLPDVGAVGAKLLYEDTTVQHGGVILRPDGRTGHEGVNLNANDPGYCQRQQLTRTCEAVTGAFLACDRAVFDDLKGFDADRFAVTYNDIDFCLGVSDVGKRVVYTPLIRFSHLESQSRGHDVAAGKRQREFKERMLFHEKWPERAFHDRWFPRQLRSRSQKPHLLLANPTWVKTSKSAHRP